MPKTYHPEDATREANNVIAAKDPDYASRWRKYEPVSLIDIAIGKCERVKMVLSYGELDEALGECIDAINYLRFLWCKLKGRE